MADLSISAEDIASTEDPSTRQARGSALYRDVLAGIPGEAMADLLQPPLRNPSVRYRDLAVDDPERRARLLGAVDEVLRSGQLLMGPAVERWEELVASYCGACHCIGVSSGTNALHLALRAFDIGPGDEVIVPAMSWVATVNAVVLADATPVFADIGDDLNLDVADAEAAITSKTRAILPVHYTGRLCDMAAIRRLADRHGLRVIEDASQAFGATDAEGRRAGGFGDAAAFSLNPMKLFPAFGEVGVVLVKDAAISERIRALRYVGTVNKEICVEPSLNHKIDTLQAAMMLVSFDWVEPAIMRRLEIARQYGERLGALLGCPPPPQSPADRRSVFFDYTVTARRRSELRHFLEARGIEVKIRHPLLMSQQPAHRHFDRRPLPNAERLVREILSLPIHEKLTDGQIDLVVESVADFHSQSER
ncbi:MAG: DegT/DnrJ/EryC1/StrS family aminotransferase [Bradyrhizobium sp.]|uniref:DegT/DnrJ/EryC1/StrS family aminotransferase n=1 Tax=Bradyrhizobium sp. TaxID=376 RepID=UPI001D7A1021|nr:DegT/DnrJ/EryC1/StrS family aminotransferase [Bradyrhizobium sp.]MBV9560893.1 DegT/DnrJ/EryC1/StrS family aminotransferase [Bradyrhizobium sp.]